MRFPSTPLIVSALLLFPALGKAQLAHDLKALQEQHDKALAVVTDPVNRRYEESLEQLLRSATERNELDLAVKIKVESAKLGFSSVENGAPECYSGGCNKKAVK